MAGRTQQRTGWIAALALLAGAVCAGSQGAASAQTEPSELFAFGAAVGIIRSELRAHLIDVDPNNGLLYAVTDEEILALDVSNPFRPRIVVRGDLSGRGSDATDMDVSGPGGVVYIAYPAEVVGHETDRLTVDSRVQIGRTADDRKVKAAPDRDDRFLTFGRGQLVTVADRGTLFDVFTDREFEFEDNVMSNRVAFGRTSDTVVGFGAVYRLNGEVADVVETPNESTWTDGMTTFRIGREHTVRFRYDSFVYRDEFLWHGAELLDQETLLTAGYAGLSAQFARSFDERGRAEVVMRSSNGIAGQPLRYYVFDPADPFDARFVWSFPLDPVDVVALGDGRLAVLEESESTEETFLSFADATLLDEDSSYGEYHPRRPERILDTRDGTGGRARPLGANTSIELDVTTGLGSDADHVIAVVMNATVPRPTRSTFVTIWPAGIDRPLVSNLNVSRGETLANMVTLPVGANRSVEIFNNAGSTDVILDRVGYYVGRDGADGLRYVPLPSERRILDTRSDQPIRSGGTINVDAGVPGRAVVVNLTAIRPSRGGFLTTWARGQSRPVASTVNVDSGRIRANLAVVPLSADGDFSIFSGAGEVDVAVDVFGYYTDLQFENTQAGRYLPATPFRFFDSREDPVFEGSGRMPAGSALIARNTEGYTDLVNVVAVNPDRSGFVSVVGSGVGQDRFAPRTSTVNFSAGETVANAAYATGGPNHAFVSPVASTHLVVDVFGYLTPERLRDVGSVWAGGA